jgi:hypothetical protein
MGNYIGGGNSLRQMASVELRFDRCSTKAEFREYCNNRNSHKESKY